MADTLQTDFTRKLAAAHAQAQAAGLKRKVYDTWADRALRRMGFRVPPTLYAPPGWLGAVLAIYFALAWGVAMHLLLWSDEMPFEAQVLVSGAAGIGFGILMTLYQSYFRRKHRLNPWSAL